MKKWVEHLLAWYEKEKRDLPWRKTNDPYAIWISEVMLQQTRVETVIAYYLRWMETFPDVERLAQADPEEVMKKWEGLGYYSRARNMQTAAKIIMAEHGGIFPSSPREILKLPGIGPYTAGAIASIAFNLPSPAVDGNVLRVLSRLFAMIEIDEPEIKKGITRLVEESFPEQRAADYTQALMELGALVCIPGSPKCTECPLPAFCEAFKKNKQDEWPQRRKKNAVKKVVRHVAIIRKGDLVLMHRRPPQGLLACLWEFPGVDCETPEMFAAQFLAYFGFGIRVGKHLLDARHVFTHLEWQMKVYHCTLEDEAMAFNEDYQWIKPENLNDLAIPAAFQQIKAVLLKV